jgi:glycosyltransferase involved in cell wall biosynthesis
MRILFLAHFYPPEMGGAAARLHGLARWLVRLGHQVTVITGFPSYPAGIVPDNYRGKLWQRELMEGVEVLRVWTYTSSHRSSLRRLGNYFSFVATSAIGGVLAGRGYDIVVASSPPLFIGLGGAVIGRLRGIPFVFDIRDIWPEVAVEAGEFAPEAAIVRWGERLESLLYRLATHITVVTPAKQRKLADKGVPLEKLSIVPNGVDLDDLSPDSKLDWRQRLNLKEKFVITYAGLIGVFQGVEIIVDAARLLKTHEDIHFLIVGDGVKRSDIEEQVAKQGLTNVTLLPPQPRSAIPGILNASDVALVPLVNDQLVDAVPSKLLEAWGCRRAVILVAGGEARRLVEESGGGVVIAPGAPEALAEAVVDLSKNQAALEKYARHGYRYVVENFDRPILARQMEDVLQGVARKLQVHAERA